MKIRIGISILLCLIASTTFGQGQSDTAGDSLNDSTSVVDSTALDSLNPAERAYQSFLDRQRQYQDTTQTTRLLEWVPALSVYDSLLHLFTSPRLNFRDELDRSFYHDAGDYFRFDPSYFILDYQSTPLRKTVQPFGLRGNRMSFVYDGSSLAPFEHTLEPDGLVDLNDLPTSSVEQVMLLPGSFGMLFGSRQTIATLLTEPLATEKGVTHTSFLADKGTFDYGFTRGRLSRQFTSGRTMDLGIEYRSADGISFSRDDDGYHYVGNVFTPVSEQFGVRASGYLYNRSGSFVARPDDAGALLDRRGIDRSADIAVERAASDRSARWLFGYRYLRQGSDYTGGGSSNRYKVRLNYHGDGVNVQREMILNGWLAKGELRVDRTRFDFGSDDARRTDLTATAVLARRWRGWNVGVTSGLQYSEDYEFLPRASLNLTTDGPSLLVMISLGYAERSPSLYELNLPEQQSFIYSGSTSNYGESGNRELRSEKQLAGSLTVELGPPDATNFRATAVGGTIDDGIEWRARRQSSLLLSFRPENTDIDFTTGTGRLKLDLWNLINLHLGGSYHYVRYGGDTLPPYTPEYQAFGGGELHVYWKQRRIHFYLYGELVYTGPYEGYDDPDLGEEIVANAKLSFSIETFRFHYVIQNALNNIYEPHEGFINPGRYTYWGVTWHFVD